MVRNGHIRKAGRVGQGGPGRTWTVVLGTLVVLLLCVAIRPQATASSATSTTEGRPSSCTVAPALRETVEQRVLPFWLRTVDPVHGGYIVPEPAGGPPIGTKQLVAQARLLWGFSHASRAGFGPDPAMYLDAARSGYRYLRAHQFDAVNGGYYWTTSASGQPLDRRKILYGQAFVIYALVEYYRASGDPAALADARQLFRVMATRARDRVHGGWIEHFEADWRPILDHCYLHVETAGYKSANTHLHVMEALAELADVAPDPGLRAALAETLDLNTQRFFPSPAATVAAFTPDWRSPSRSWRPRPMREWLRTLARGPLVSYGHNVEFAWMARRAEQVLGRPSDRAALDRFLVHTLERGVDLEQGGVYEFGYGDRPAHGLDKVWWQQAELLSALSVALEDRPSARYDVVRGQLLAWTTSHQSDSATGVWRERVRPDGRVAPGPLAHAWKLNYHDLRAVTTYLVGCGAVTLR